MTQEQWKEWEQRMNKAYLEALNSKPKYTWDERHPNLSAGLAVLFAGIMIVVVVILHMEGAI